ncbi:hypothetical protein SNOG_09399 [Parastagonospora nodorum SN15]|uniref:Uncharacterized protein n=1 Tax=Phaeosphaeria nodorum (strain SN15 / ATCC MYA-4574 / FGSC 10173) TaxID=321614 RepID=Q0UFR5_PHANO|nr:hypothetical protein SNOG_09399 [Parastagonospora nodorum SN15]EAT83591.1 hypothetical protein SNOG_09399 [Parastagonospora nodorum SN15]
MYSRYKKTVPVTNVQFHTRRLCVCAPASRVENAGWTAAAKLICHDRRASVKMWGLASLTKGKATANPLLAPRNSGRRDLEPLLTCGAFAPGDTSTS